MSNYTPVSEVQRNNEQRITQLFDKYSIFFAFSNKQLSEGMKKIGIDNPKKLVSLGSGMVCPAKHVKKFTEELDEVTNQNNKDLLDKSGIDNLIRYELANHESYYTSDCTDAIEKMESYGYYNVENIHKIFKEEFHKKCLADEI